MNAVQEKIGATVRQNNDAVACGRFNQFASAVFVHRRFPLQRVRSPVQRDFTARLVQANEGILVREVGTGNLRVLRGKCGGGFGVGCSGINDASQGEVKPDNEQKSFFHCLNF